MRPESWSRRKASAGGRTQTGFEDGGQSAASRRKKAAMDGGVGGKGQREIGSCGGRVEAWMERREGVRARAGGRGEERGGEKERETARRRRRRRRRRKWDSGIVCVRDGQIKELSRSTLRSPNAPSRTSGEGAAGADGEGGCDWAGPGVWARGGARSGRLFLIKGMYGNQGRPMVLG